MGRHKMKNNRFLILLSTVFALVVSSSFLSCVINATKSAKIGFDGIDPTKWLYNQDDDVYYQLGIVYVAKPADWELENLAIFVPAAFMDSKDNGDGTFTCSVNENRTLGDFGYTAKTAPVLFPMNTFGYSAQNPLKEYASYSDYTSQGMIYVHAGSRGREAGVPAGAVDLKAAIRFVRSQQGTIPGNMERVISFGMSGGGGMSLILGTSGDSPLFEPYLEEIGAVKGFSDAVLASQAWCPITTLDSADAAYEWMMGNTRANLSKEDEEISLSLTQAYAEYINALGLKDGAGNPLILEESTDGRYQAGTYYDFIKTTIETSLNNFLSDTKFPFDTASQNQDHGGQGGMGNVKPIRPNGGNMARGAEAMDNVSRVSNSGGITLSGIYNTAKDYIDALNANGTWVIYNDRMNKATITSVADFTNAVKRASKNLGAFDQYDKSQAENTLFGNGNGKPAHFDKILTDILLQKKSEYAQSYAEDLALKDSLGNTQDLRMNMYSPLYYMLPSSKGRGTSKVAKFFRINSGLWQGDTALSTEANIALALLDAGATVNFETVWGKGHTWAERKGESSANFIQWVHDCIVSEEVDE